MKIAVAVHNNVRADARVIRQARTLRRAGHAVAVWGLTAQPGGEHFEIDGGIPVTLVERTKPRAGACVAEADDDLAARVRAAGGDDTTLKQARKVMASFAHQGRLLADAIADAPQPDAVHIHDHVALTAVARYRRELGLPVVWDAHEIYEALAGLEDVRRHVNPAIIAAAQHHVDRFVTISDSIATFYAERYPGLPSATVLPNAAEHAPAARYDGRLHAAAGLPASQRILLFQGGFAAHRGIGHLLAAAPDLAPHWSVVFMGWGAMQEMMEAAVAAMPPAMPGVPRAAIIPGAPHAELMAWTAGASLGAIPYENVGLNHLYCTPNKLWEYPMAGVPILATDLVELGRSLRSNGIGVLLPRAFDAEDVVQAVNGTTDDGLASMGRACARYAERENWQAYEGSLLNCYATLCPRPSSWLLRVLGLSRAS